MEMLEHNASAGALELGTLNPKTLNPRACHRDDEGPSLGLFPFGEGWEVRFFWFPMCSTIVPNIISLYSISLAVFSRDMINLLFGYSNLLTFFLDRCRRIQIIT
jgi:hypothetical protein